MREEFFRNLLHPVPSVVQDSNDRPSHGARVCLISIDGGERSDSVTDPFSLRVKIAISSKRDYAHIMKFVPLSELKRSSWSA